MVFGIIEFGRILMVRNAISNAAREGCRSAALATTLDRNTVDATVARFLRPIVPLSKVNVQVTPNSLGSIESDTDVTVQVSINYSDASWLSVNAFTSGLVLRATSSKRRE
jgi:Flp pilus assembly protein TadG